MKRILSTILVAAHCLFTASLLSAKIYNLTSPDNSISRSLSWTSLEKVALYAALSL